MTTLHTQRCPLQTWSQPVGTEQRAASHFLAGCGLPAREFSRLQFHSLRSQEFNSDAESHFQRCYICITLQLGISVAQVNQLSLHLHTNKNLFPFPKSPSSFYNHSLGSVFSQTSSPYCIWEITGSAAISFSVCHPSEHKRSDGGGEGQDETLFLCLQKPVTDISSWPVAVASWLLVLFLPSVFLYGQWTEYSVKSLNLLFFSKFKNNVWI